MTESHTTDTARDAFARTAAAAVLSRLVANYQTDRDEIADSDLDDEQPIAITFRGTLADIRLARRAAAILTDAPPVTDDDEEEEITGMMEG